MLQDLVQLAIERELGLGLGRVECRDQRLHLGDPLGALADGLPQFLGGGLGGKRRSGRRRLPPTYCVTLTLKYFAAGWWQMIAEVLCSGTSWNSSLSATPMREASSSGNSRDWSSMFGQAG